LLVDVARGLVPQLRPLTYLASILFFPYLVSGPITYYREFAPQIEAEPRDWLRNGITESRCSRSACSRRPCWPTA
jgi:D-alanyl-lipoteichoic acid acyltransferase DltB (MBOAT superfamily)